MGTTSDCVHINVNLNSICYLYYSKVSSKIIKTSFICYGRQLHWWYTLNCEYLCEYSKKFETTLMGYSGAWGKLIHE
jgi:hypothetical protein